MQRRRSPFHTFGGQIAAEKAKLEAEVGKLPPGPRGTTLSSPSAFTTRLQSLLDNDPPARQLV
jgi:hypothetical protein